MRKIQKISHSHVAFEALRCPVPLLKSSLGTLCLTTHDLQEDIADKFVCQLDIGDFMNKSFGNTGYAELIKKPNNQWSTSAKGLQISTASGRKNISLKDFLHRVELDRPEAFIAMADEVSFLATEKRRIKSIHQTTSWFNTAMSQYGKEPTDQKSSEYSPFVFGVALAYIEPASLLASTAVELLQQGANGICVGGLGLGESMEQRSMAIETVRQAVGANVPIVVQGMNSMTEIAHAIRSGATFISTNYPAVVTNTGSAIASMDISRLSSSPSVPNEAPPSVEELINVRDRKYREDPTPLVRVVLVLFVALLFTLLCVC